MEVLFIAILHAIPPFIGAITLGWTGLVWGTRIGAICALVFGVLIFTIPDLFGVAIGAAAGLARLKGKDATKDFEDLLTATLPSFFRSKNKS